MNFERHENCSNASIEVNLGLYIQYNKLKYVAPRNSKILRFLLKKNVRKSNIDSL